MANRLLNSQLFISRLSFYTTNNELKRLFSPFGQITEARLVVDPRTQRPKGFGFVTFESDVDAQNALKAMNGKIVNGGLIFVEFAKTKTPEELGDTLK
ncbi:RNA-binding (RRM/RBD/RNP motifs) family protein [Artemisia annua]|uniref:RNA-binding (RRM/RBD/RNP motifs) family protein n=1 Tax=Artemisia annua TaxID=35608 RepID=A0A2U1NB56_ARTAN|nr:RNA-binding (RRM/RBD/RNP motifs) family protein [Artemisia annua]